MLVAVQPHLAVHVAELGHGTARTILEEIQKVQRGGREGYDRRLLDQGLC